jgi:cytochrome P450
MTDADFDRLPEVGNELLKQINAMREESPVMWSERAQAWVVTRHADLVQAYSGKMPIINVRWEPPFSSVPKEDWPKRFPNTMRTIGFWPVFTDPPLHTKLRKLLTRAFGRETVEGLRPFVRENIRRILDRAADKGEVEFVREVTRPVTAGTIMHLLGVPDSYFDKMERWSLVMNTALGSVKSDPKWLDGLEDIVTEMRVLFDAELARRRAAPTDDFISQMVLARDGRIQLTDDEIIGVCYVVLIAGHDTTMNSLGLGTFALAHHPEACRYMLEHPEQIGNSVMEVSRYIAMSTIQPRVITEDFEWHGQKLKKGDYMLLVIAGANRDPRVFDHPEELDMTRATDQAVVFGAGIHHCIGHLLAKMTLAEFWPALFGRFNVEVLDTQIEFAQPVSQRGPARMRVRLTRKDTQSAAA